MKAKLVVGSWPETGFCYDFGCPTPFAPEGSEQIDEPYKLKDLNSITNSETITRPFIGCSEWIRDGAHQVLQIRRLIASSQWEQR